MERTNITKQKKLELLINNPLLAIREINNKSFFEFVKFFWPEISNDTFQSNWHIELICDVVQEYIIRVGNNLPKTDDLLFNVPPGTSKTSILSILLEAWAWTLFFHLRFICISYSANLSLESAEKCRDLIRSERFRMIYPELSIKDDKDTKGNFRIVRKEYVVAGRLPRIIFGGGRLSTSVDAVTTGFHGHVIVWDDLLSPKQSVSQADLTNANNYLSQTLSTRKTDKKVTLTIGVMQRLAANDPTEYWLGRKKNVKHYCLPGTLDGYEDMVKPAELKQYYVNGLLDPVRLDQATLDELEADLGQYGFAGQVGQRPTPPTGGMFKVDKFQIVDAMPNPVSVIRTIRYWDKAGTKEILGLDQKNKNKGPCYTVGLKMSELTNGKWLISDVKRGRWESEDREDVIRSTAEADGPRVKIFHEQEPGSGGKQSAQQTDRDTLKGFNSESDQPKGDKVFRADPLSVQVNRGNILLLNAIWNKEFIEEYRDFPFGKFKDQVDAGSGAYSKLTGKKKVKTH